MAKRPTRLERAREKVEDAETEHQRAMEAEYPIGAYPVYIYGAGCSYEIKLHGPGRLKIYNRENNTTRWVHESRVHTHWS